MAGTKNRIVEFNIFYEEHKPVETVSNKNISFSFDSKTGMFVEMRNLRTGNSCLKKNKGVGNPFAVYYDFHREFEFPGIPSYTPEPLPGPSELARKVFSPVSSDKVGIKKKGSTLHLTYSEGPWQAEMTVSLEEQFSRWGLKVKNVSDQPCSMMGVFPFLNGVRVGNGKKNLMAVNDESGYVRPLWAKRVGKDFYKERGGIYGQGLNMSMQWGCMFDEETKDALGFIVEDKEIRNKEIVYEKPAVQVRYFPPVMVKPGETYDFPTVRILVYVGDWKPTASHYHQWFTKAFKIVKPPAWAGKIDSHRGRWVFKHDQELTQSKEAVDMLGNFMSSFAELPAMYLREPADLFEIAFFSRASMGPKISGKRFAHTDGDNTVREDLGGVVAMREGIRGIHKAGHRLTLYIEGYIVNDDADIVLHGKARDWAVMNKDGSNNGVYTAGKCLHMCPGSVGWQDHLAKTCAELVRRTGADGIRLDSLGSYFFPCYNPKHHHESPWDFNRWICQLLEKVAKAVRKVNPDCFLTTEVGVDFFSQYFHGSLAQAVNESPVAVSRDVPPMRVALPEYSVILHSPHGPVSASVSGYTGGSVYWNVPGIFPQYEQCWRAARFPVADVLRWGNAAHDNPQSGRNDVTCRRFSGAGMEVVVGARYQYPKVKTGGYAEKNANIEIKKDRVKYDVRLEDLPAKPRRVYLVDILSRTAREISGRGGRFQIDCNWFMLIILNGCDQPLARMDISTPRCSDGELRLNVELLGNKSSRPIRAGLKAPSLNLYQKITIPGSVCIRLGKEVPPGKHMITLEAKGLLGAKGFVTLVPGNS
jgi:hypothetical protein